MKSWALILGISEYFFDDKLTYKELKQPVLLTSQYFKQDLL